IVMSRAVYLNTLRQHIAILLLFIFAGANALANSLLLPQHIYYATWYAVPETIAIVLLGSFTAILAWKAAPRKARTAWVALALVLLSVSEPLYEWYTDLAPRAYSADGGSLHEAWEADLWAEQHLPTGARVGSLSSGLLGYFMQDRTVINLDGLANSPEYVRTVWLHHLLYTHGLAQDGELWAYIRANDIQYIANPEWESGLGQRPFLEIIPPSNYEIVYRGQQLIQWGEPEGPRRYVIVKLRY
ncbi:MAG TPA: hypothetical protein VFU22_13885, partial [Roseiflexaceae bacterium]|nr:hypothetical protein [Roseiflexaceae bacterium]